MRDLRKIYRAQYLQKLAGKSTGGVSAHHICLYLGGGVRAEVTEEERAKQLKLYQAERKGRKSEECAAHVMPADRCFGVLRMTTSSCLRCVQSGVPVARPSGSSCSRSGRRKRCAGFTDTQMRLLSAVSCLSVCLSVGVCGGQILKDRLRIEAKGERQSSNTHHSVHPPAPLCACVCVSSSVTEAIELTRQSRVKQKHLWWLDSLQKTADFVSDSETAEEKITRRKDWPDRNVSAPDILRQLGEWAFLPRPPPKDT